ncbi:MAG TPA: sigma-54 dependent transcriptional regulator, partial [Rhodocyclaceae bacterium]|nr:sigma-54 dependent transcriptional regulator [Rhodocyclaceae bacterium]
MSQAAEKPSLLIVDDDPLIVDTLSYFLARDFAVSTAASRPEALELVRQGAAAPAIALIDLGLPPVPHRPDEGFALVAELTAYSPATHLVILSGQNDEGNARHARALGATEFVVKPADPEFLRQLLLRLLAYRPVVGAGPASEAIELVGHSPSMEKLRTQLRQYANSPFPVLIEGESGCGKEIAAGALHRLSDRRDKPYLALNCAAISANLVEPTLFGHAKGAFTGAAGARAGYFEDAAEGTLFLDEVGELPLDLQPKLLRVLENGEYQRVGETQTRTSRARVIAATNRDLKKEVRAGRFRADLYHRLSVFAVHAPPLREMGDDRMALLDHFRRLYARQAGQAPFALSAEAEARWRSYDFPGNVRELRNIVIRLITKHGGEMLSAGDLEAELDVETGAADGTVFLPRGDKALLDVALRQLGEGDGFSLDDTLRRWEAAYIEAARQLTNGNIS